MSIEKLAQDFTKAVAEDRMDDVKAYWADDIVSLEPQDGEMARTEGREQLQAKHDWWEQNTEVHSSSAEGPFVYGDQFAVRYDMDVTMDGQRNHMSEVGLYTVRDGKIVEERFMYAGEQDNQKGNG